MSRKRLKMRNPAPLSPNRSPPQKENRRSIRGGMDNSVLYVHGYDLSPQEPEAGRALISSILVDTFLGTNVSF